MLHNIDYCILVHKKITDLQVRRSPAWSISKIMDMISLQKHILSMASERVLMSREPLPSKKNASIPVPSLVGEAVGQSNGEIDSLLAEEPRSRLVKHPRLRAREEYSG
jgi:hypothetical protein